jgi:Outer membrane efflux protein
LERENRLLRQRAERAEALVGVQKKLSVLLGIEPHPNDERSWTSDRDGEDCRGGPAPGGAGYVRGARSGAQARFTALEVMQARRNLAISSTADTVAQKRFDVAYNRYVIGRISIDNLYIAQQEKDQARTQYVRALRGYWEAYYRLRRVTLYDFERNQVIR